MVYVKRLALTAFVLFLVYIFIWALFIPKQDFKEKVTQKIEAQKEKADLIFKGVTFSEIVNGVKYWELHAVESRLNKSTEISNLTKVNGTFFQNGKPVLNFIAPAANWDMKAKEIFLEKALGYDSQAGDKLFKNIPDDKKYLIFSLNNKYINNKTTLYWFKAKTLNWRLSDKNIRCKNGIILTQDKATLWANQFEGDVALAMARFFDQPKAIIKYNHKQQTDINAKEFMINSQPGEISAIGQVVIKHNDKNLPIPDLLITCNNLIYHQSKNYITLNGSIEVKYGNIVAKSNKAFFDPKQQLVSLSDHARAYYKENWLTGNKLSVDLSQNKVAIEGKSRIIINEEEILP